MVGLQWEIPVKWMMTGGSPVSGNLHRAEKSIWFRRGLGLSSIVMKDGNNHGMYHHDNLIPGCV